MERRFLHYFSEFWVFWVGTLAGLQRLQCFPLRFLFLRRFRCSWIRLWISCTAFRLFEFGQTFVDVFFFFLFFLGAWNGPFWLPSSRKIKVVLRWTCFFCIIVLRQPSFGWPPHDDNKDAVVCVGVATLNYNLDYMGYESQIKLKIWKNYQPKFWNYEKYPLISFLIWEILIALTSHYLFNHLPLSPFWRV